MGKKKCQAKDTSTGKKCRLQRIKDSEFCRVHENIHFPVPDADDVGRMILYFDRSYIPKKTDPGCQDLDDDDITFIPWLYLPRDVLVSIYNFSSILDIRVMSMTCKYMRSLSLTYWNDHSRFYALADMYAPPYSIFRGMEQTSFKFADSLRINESQSYYRTPSLQPCIYEELEDEDLPAKLLGWTHGVVYGLPLYELYTRLDSKRSFMYFCRRLANMTAEDILMAEIHLDVPSGEPPFTEEQLKIKNIFKAKLREVTVKFAMDLAVLQIIKALQKNTVSFEIDDEIIRIDPNIELFKKAKNILKETFPKAEILILNDDRILLQLEPRWV